MEPPSANTKPSFHLFPLLPFELRVHIWRLTATPRTVEVRLRYNSVALDHQDGENTLYLPQPYPALITGLTPIPAPLHTCSEARNALILGRQAIYQKAYADCIRRFIGKHHHYSNNTANSTSRYIWANWSIDTLSMGPINHIRDLYPAAEALTPKRLRFWWGLERSVADVLNLLRNLSAFKYVKEVEVVCEGGIQEGNHSWGIKHRSSLPWVSDELVQWNIETFWLVDPLDERNKVRWTEWNLWRAQRRPWDKVPGAEV